MDPPPAAPSTSSVHSNHQSNIKNSNSISQETSYTENHSHNHHQSSEHHSSMTTSEYIAANMEYIRGKQSRSSERSTDKYKNMAHKPLKKFTHKGTHGRYHDQNKDKSVDLSRGQNSQAKNITMHQVLV